MTNIFHNKTETGGTGEIFFVFTSNSFHLNSLSIPNVLLLDAERQLEKIIFCCAANIVLAQHLEVYLPTGTSQNLGCHAAIRRINRENLHKHMFGISLGLKW